MTEEAKPFKLNVEAIETKIVTADALVGTLLADRYQIIELIGKGATSSVYRAMDTSLDHGVAVKVLHSHLTTDEEIVKRFKQEVRTASLVTHANVVAIHDCSATAGGQPYFVMDYVDGQSLQQLIQEAGWLPPDRAIAIFAQVCAALTAAHEKGIVHRDLKPSNIMVTRMEGGQDLVKVLDFGVAKILPVQGETFQRLTQSGEMLGSLLYMSPEQCLDQDVDGRSDIYSLGCVLYEALTGKPPLCGRTAFETMNKHMSDTAQRLDKVRPDLHFHPALERIIFKAMAKQPQDRYESASSFLQDLQSLPATSGTIVQQSDPTANHSMVVQSDLFMTDAAQKELVIERWTSKSLTFGIVLIALVLVASIIYSLATGRPPDVLLMGKAADWATALSVQTILMLAPMLIMCGLRSTSKQSIKRMSQALSIISSVAPSKILVYHVQRVSPESFNYHIQVGASSGSQTTKKRLIIRRTNPGVADHEFWNALCSASQLSDIGQSGVFPISCDVSIDPETQEPVALTINGHFTWVIS